MQVGAHTMQTSMQGQPHVMQPTILAQAPMMQDQASMMM
jgi:hypothetical protein